MIQASAAFIAGMIVGGLFFAISIFSGQAKIITTGFACTKTEIIGDAPSRYETCVRYERKDKP